MLSILKKKKHDLIAIAVIVILITAFCLPLLLRMDKAFTMRNKESRNIWYDYYHNAAFFYISVMVHHQLPYWCASYEGGVPWQMNPTDISVNPLFLPVLIFGVIKGLNISWYIIYLLGAFSMFYLTRVALKFDIASSVFSSMLFAMNSYFPYMQESGYFTAREMILFPFVIGFFIRGIKENRFIILAALVLALIIFQASLYYSIAFLFLLLFTVITLIVERPKQDRHIRRYWFVFCTVIGLSLLFAAFKLLPILELLHADIRPSGEIYQHSELYPNTLGSFIKRLVTKGKIWPGGLYVGWLPVAMCLGAAVVLFRRLKVFVILLFLFIWLSLGSNSIVDLHYLIWHLPIFKSIKEVAQYYGVIVILLISMISGSFFMVIRKRLSKKWGNVAIVLITVITFCDLVWGNAGYFNAYDSDVPLTLKSNTIIQTKQIGFWWGDEGGLPALRLALFDKGYGMTNFHFTFNQYFIPLPISPKYLFLPEYAFLIPGTKSVTFTNPAYTQEVFWRDSKNSIDGFSMSSNEMQVQVTVLEPDVLIFNQRYDRFWQSSQGVVRNSDNLLSLEISKAGKYRIELKYIPARFYAGLCISLISFLGAVYLLIICKKRN